jgi:hypothetical protein
MVIKVIQELTPQEFVNTLRKGTAWLITEDVDADRLLMDVRDDEDGCTLYYGPRPGTIPAAGYEVFLDEVKRIITEKGA